MRGKSIREQFADTVCTIGKDDNRLVVLVSDISHGILQNFAEHCPERYYNIGVNEQSMIGISAGFYFAIMSIIDKESRELFKAALLTIKKF